YYGAPYRRLGVSPWFAYGRSYHDPLFSYYQWTHRNDRGWYQGLRQTYLGRVSGDLPRPARTLVAQNRLVRNITNNRTIINRNGTNISRTNLRNSYQLVKPITQIRNNNIRLTSVSRNQINNIRNVQKNFRNLSLNRQKVEGGGTSLVGR